MPTLIHEPGSSTANSFLSLARAEELAAEHPSGAAWIAQSTDAKSTQLIRATRILSRQCYLGVAGIAGQVLAWPRAGLFDRNGRAIAAATIPLDIELATIELAIMLRAGGPGDPTLSLPEQALQGLTKLKAGPIELGFKEAWTEADGLPSSVRDLIDVPGWLCAEVAEGTRRLVVWNV